MKKTKYLVRFLNRAAQFDADLELADVFATAVQSGRLFSPESRFLFDFVDPNKHSRLSNRKISDHNRNLALNHLKSTIRAAFLKDIYEDVAAYMVELLAGAAKAGLSPERLVGEHRVTFEVNDILKCGNWDNVIKLVADSLFRKIENERSTLKLLVAIDKKLNLGVPEKAIQEALPYLEIRHLLVHADGVADAEFCKKFPTVGAVAGETIPLSYFLVSTARTKTVEMVTQYDQCAVQKNAILDTDLQP